MLLHKAVDHDARVLREARALADAGHEVTIVHLPPRPERGVRRLPGGVRLRSATPPAWGRRRLPGQAHRLLFLVAFLRMIRALGPDVLHAHDAGMLAPGLLGARLTGARLVYDSHELATGVQWRSRPWAAVVRALERLAVPRCAAVITVSDGIAATVAARYRLRRRPIVVRNVPDVVPRPVGAGGAEPRDLRRRFGIGPAPLVLHHGSAAPGRGCDALVRALARLEGAHVLFLGPENPADLRRLRRVAERAGVAGRVHFAARVPVGQVVAVASQADVGVSLLEDTCENHRLALPNKVFDYLAAGLPVVVSELPELGRLVRDRGVGVTARPGDPADIARALSEVLDASDGDALRARVGEAAADLRWGRERRRLEDLYAELAVRAR